MANYVIFDIHGRYDYLMDVLEQVDFDYENDTIISIGDLCDRGDDNYKVVDEFTKIHNKFMVIGNHDVELRNLLLCMVNNIDYKRKYGVNGWLSDLHGGMTTYLDYKDRNKTDIKRHLDFINKQVPYVIFKNKLFVHAGIDLTKSIYSQNLDTLFKDRSFAYDVYNDNIKINFIDGFDRIYIGHTPTFRLHGKDEPIILPKVIMGDTGCGKGGILTIINIDTDEVYQSKKK